MNSALQAFLLVFAVFAGVGLGIGLLIVVVAGAMALIDALMERLP